MDFYLKFPDEATARAVLFDGEDPLFRNIDTVGVIHKPTGEMLDTDEGPMPVMQAIPGWHVNVRLVDGEDGAALEPFAVTPTTPSRVWA